MGQLVNGLWVKGSVSNNDKSGTFKRVDSVFRNNIGVDEKVYTLESNRYHLYVSYACPWAHRALIFRKLKNLEDHISVDVVHPDMLDMGWSFDTRFLGSTGDTLHQKQYVHEIYQLADKNVSSKVTVPILWDKKTNTIVNNESAEIIRILNFSFNDISNNHDDYYPVNLQNEIDDINEVIYQNINNGVYKTGFSKTQSSYENSAKKLFESLDMIENKLENRTYLVSDIMTEADIRFLPTLLRFDCVYYSHFKCNLRKISEYSNISRYLRTLFKNNAVKSTTNFEHIKRHYYFSRTHKPL